jgi:hypothetical protein
MCLICVEFNSGKLTLEEAWRNLGEMLETMEEDHRDDVFTLLYDAVDARLERIASIHVDASNID